MVALDLFLGALISAALTYGVVMELNGARPSLRDCVAIGFAQLLPVVGVVFISSFTSSPCSWGSVSPSR